MELLTAAGPGTIALVGDLGSPVFVDVKLHDIPTTVRRAARNLGAMGARWVSVHASGGATMLSAAVTGLAEGAAGRPAGVLAVTVLTSLEDDSLAAWCPRQHGSANRAFGSVGRGSGVRGDGRLTRAN